MLCVGAELTVNASISLKRFAAMTEVVCAVHSADRRMGHTDSGSGLQSWRKGVSVDAFKFISTTMGAWEVSLRQCFASSLHASIALTPDEVDM